MSAAAPIYRMAGENDLAQLAELRWDFRYENDGHPEDAVAKEDFLNACRAFLKDALASGQWAFWVAELDGQIIAQTFVQRIAKVPRPNHLSPAFGYLTNVYTRPEYRSQGIGGQLMEHAKDWARQQGLEMLVLWPAEGRQGFYERAGFRSDSLEMEWQVEEL